MFSIGLEWKKKGYFCLYLLQPTLFFFSPSPLPEAMGPMAIDADGDDCYSTGRVPEQQGQPDLNNL